MRPFLLFLSSLLLTGCSGEVEKTYKTLSELQRPQIIVRIDEAGTRLELYPGYGEACPAFAGTGLMNGKPLELTEPGGWYQTIGGFIPYPEPACRYPTWRLPTPLPEEAVTEFAIQDPTGSLTMGVLNLAAKRSLAYRAPTTPNLRWGQLVEIDVFPSTDLVWGAPVYLDTGDHTPHGLAEDSDLDLARAEEGILSFHLPATPPEGWPTTFRDARLVFQKPDIRMQLTHCEPAMDQCVASVRLPPGEVALPVSIE